MSRIYFPLRSNAHSLVAGRGTASVIKRIKLASLLHDEVVLGSGHWLAAAGPYGSQTVISPADEATRWDAPSTRGKALDSTFEMWAPISEDGVEQRLDLIVRREVTLAWGATFEPLRRQLRRRHSWVDFADFVLSADDEARVGAMVAADVADGRLRQLVGNEVAQRVVAGDVAFDLVVASRIEASVSTDPLHMRVVLARIARGDAKHGTGEGALDVLVPTLGSMTWDDIAYIRRNRDLRALRSVLATIEDVAWTAYERGTPLEEAVNAEYVALLERASRHALSFSSAFRAAGLAVAVSLVTGLIPAVPAAALAFGGELVRQVRGAARFETSWLAALMDIKSRASSGS